MSIPVLMPKLSAGADEVVLLRWLRSPGEAIRHGDVLAEIETDKALVELTSPSEGLLRTLVVEEGARVRVGDEVARLMGASADESRVQQDETAKEGSRGEDYHPSRAAVGPRFRISPVARRRAEELDLSPDSLRGIGSGPGGRILLCDVEKAAARKARGEVLPAAHFPETASDSRAEPFSKVRTAVAVHMMRSARTVPQFSVNRQADVTNVLELRNQFNRYLPGEKKLSPVDFVLQATANALRLHPRLNAALKGTPGEGDAQTIFHDRVNIGLATSTPVGLLVPVLLDADTLSLVELAVARKDAVRRSMEGRLLQDESAARTFTISNLGPLGADEFVAMVNPPDAAILAVGRAMERPAVHGGDVVVRSLMSLTVTADHRILDGAEVTKFLLSIVASLEDPTAWVLA